MGDMNGEPGRPQRVNLATAPGSRDSAYRVHGAFRVRPERARLHDRDPARKRSTSDTSQPRGRRKCRRVLCELGTDGSPCRHVCEAPRAACRVFCSRNARSGSTGRYAWAGLHGLPCRFGVRVTSPGTSWRELRVNSACCPAWGIPRKRALSAMPQGDDKASIIIRRKSRIVTNERASRRPPPWWCKKIKKINLAPSTRPQPGCGKHPCLGKGALVSRMGLA